MFERKKTFFYFKNLKKIEENEKAIKVECK